MTDKAICRNDGRCEYAIQSGAEKEGGCPAGKCAMPCDTPAHLTIPGALEWDGDNGTHGADGESRADGESSELEQLRKKTALTMGVGCGAGQLFVHGDYESIKAAQAIVLEGERLRAELANTEQSRRSLFDLSKDLEKRLADRDAVLNQAYMALIGYLPDHRNDLTDAAIAACSAILFPAEAKAACSRCGGWGHIETEDSAHDCPECGPSVIERAVEAGVMNAPSKPKTCIECDQPYCHGVCVERGDQDYDRDQAAKGGEQ